MVVELTPRMPRARRRRDRSAAGEPHGRDEQHRQPEHNPDQVELLIVSRAPRRLSLSASSFIIRQIYHLLSLSPSCLCAEFAEPRALRLGHLGETRPPLRPHSTKNFAFGTC
jgi:hypothetical protein